MKTKKRKKKQPAYVKGTAPSGRVWVEVAPGRQKLVENAAVVSAERERRIANHTNKVLHRLCVHPDQAAEFNRDARQSGFTDIHFDADGKCISASRKAEQEYHYYRRQEVNMDGGYYETIPDSRRREIDRLRELHG